MAKKDKNSGADSLGFGDLDSWFEDEMSEDAGQDDSAEQARLEEERAREAARLAEQRRQEEARRLEEQRRQEEARLAEQRRQEEARRLEEQRRQEEARLAEQRRQEEARRLEEQRRQEEARRLEEQRRQEEARRLEEQRRQEEARLAEQRRQEELRRQEEARLAEQRRQEEARRQSELAALEDDWFSGQAAADGGSSATIVAPDDEPAPEPAPVVVTPPVLAPPVLAPPPVLAQAAPVDDAPAEVEDDEDDVLFTADGFDDSVDQNLVMQRGAEPASDLPEEPSGSDAAAPEPEAVEPAAEPAIAEPVIAAPAAQTPLEEPPSAELPDLSPVAPAPPVIPVPPHVSIQPEAQQPEALPTAEVEVEPLEGDRWYLAARMLEAEADATADASAAAALRAEAGRIYWLRVGDADSADRLLRQAWAAGGSNAELLKVYGDVAAARGDYPLLRDLLTQRAAMSSGAVAAEALQDAALVERRVLRQDAAAAELLGRALVEVPDDWFTLRLLRELHYHARNWTGLTEVLGDMAGLASGPRAARYLVEQGRIYEEQLGQREEAIASYELSLEAEPGFPTAFLAVERLALAMGDLPRLVRLYEAEAKRNQGADASFWWARAARLSVRAGLDADRVAAAYEAALASAVGDPVELRREQERFLMAQGRHDDLVAALRAEAAAVSGGERAFVLYRLGRVLDEQLGRVDEALAAWREAVEADPTADPVIEMLGAVLVREGRVEELVALLASQAEHTEDANLEVTILYRMGELSESALEQPEAARDLYLRILEKAPGYLPALEGLERVYARLGEWGPLVDLTVQRANHGDNPASSALHFFRAGTVAELRLGDPAVARDLYRSALEQVPNFMPALDAFTRLLESDGDWSALAETLMAAASASEDGNEVVSLTYRAARLFAERVDQPEQAIMALRRCLELSPGFLPAIGLLRSLCERVGAWQDAYELHRQEAETAENPNRRHWRMLAAAEVAEHLADIDAATVAMEILQEDPMHQGAVALLEERALASDDPAGLVDVYRRRAAGADAETQVRLVSRIADLARDAGDSVAAIQAVSEAVGLDVAGRPLGALARLAEGLHYWEEAQRALQAAGEDVNIAELARIQETYVGDASVTAAAWRQLLDSDPVNTEAAAGLERSLTRLGAREGLTEVHAILADNLPDPAIRSVHALLAGHLNEAAGDREASRRYYQQAFDARPAAGKAFDALRRIMAAEQDAAGIEALFAALPSADSLSLAVALEDAGAPVRAAAIYRQEIVTHLADDPEILPLLLRLEECLTDAEDWKGVFETITQRLAIMKSPAEKRALESRRRWILAEKLAETAEAWDFYRQLHQESPEDPDVLESLARIAGARGESELSIGYLEGLTRSAKTAADAARYQRRIAEVCLRMENLDGARQAFLTALDYQPEDLESLSGLKALAEREQNWGAMVGVLAREATMLDGEERVARYRQIAGLWEEALGDAAVAIDAWRKVLDVVPGDVEALSHLLELCRSHGDWVAFIETARSRVEQLDGEARSALLTEIGQVFLSELHHEGEAINHLELASRSDPPSLDAARLLENIYASRGEHEQVVSTLRRQAHILGGEEAIRLLVRAAQLRQDTQHDQDGVADIYAEVLELDPANAEALRFRGAWLFRAGDLEGALEIYRRLEGQEEGRDLDDFDVKMEVSLYYYRYAEAERQLGQEATSMGHYRRALELNPSHLPSLEAVGPLYLNAGQWEQAGEVYRQILQLTGGQGDLDRIAQTYVNLGTVEYRLGDADKAKKRFNKALELRPNHIGALLGTAEVLAARQDWNNLLNIYNNIIYHAQEESRVIEAYLAKGYVLDAKMNLPDKAAQHYEKGLAFDPAQPKALLRLAEMSIRRRDWAQANSLAERGLALTIEDSGLLSGLHLARAVAAHGLGNGGVAFAALEAALESDGTLREQIGDGGADQLHRVLKARLQAKL